MYGRMRDSESLITSVPGRSKKCRLAGAMEVAAGRRDASDGRKFMRKTPGQAMMGKARVVAEFRGGFYPTIPLNYILYKSRA